MVYFEVKREKFFHLVRLLVGYLVLRRLSGFLSFLPNQVECSLLRESHRLEKEFASIEVDHLSVSICHLYLIINNDRLTIIVRNNILKTSS